MRKRRKERMSEGVELFDEGATMHKESERVGEWERVSV